MFVTIGTCYMLSDLEDFLKDKVQSGQGKYMYSYKTTHNVCTVIECAMKLMGN